MTAYVDVAHLSGRYDVRPAVFAQYVATVAAEGYDIITTTETNRAMLRAICRKLGKSWRVTRSGEYVIAWRRSTVTQGRRVPARRRVTRVHPIAAWRDVWTHSRRLVHRDTGQHLRIDVAHMPAGVESGDDFRVDQPEQVRAWKQGMNRLGRRAGGRDVNLVQVLAMDANVDYHRRKWREEVGRRLGMPSCWDGRRPDRGSHHRRLIDVIHSTAPMTRAHLTSTPRPAGVDHHGIACRIHL